jgi:hypothetical protein
MSTTSTTITDEISDFINNLPSYLTGNGSTFVTSLKSLLTTLSTTIDSSLTDVTSLYNEITDTSDTIDDQISNLTITENRNNTDISFSLNWDSSAIDNYNGCNIYVYNFKGTQASSIDWSSATEVSSITTPKSNTYTINNISAGYVYKIVVQGINTYGGVSTLSECPYIVYDVSSLNNVPDAPTSFTVTFDKQGVYWKWQQPTDLDYSYSELRTDTNVGNATNLLEITQDTYSRQLPNTRQGTAYLYNKGYGSRYSADITCDWTKPIPIAPSTLSVASTYQGLQITYSAIPSDCIGIVIVINGEKHYTSDDTFNFYCSTGSYVIQGAYYDSFGIGTYTSTQTIDTVETIPSDAIHITTETVFDDGVIVGKYIGDKEVVGTKIADGAITTDKIYANSITSGKIATNAITTDTINANAITTEKIATNAITTDTIASDAITSTKIASNSITTEKFATDSVELSGDLKVVGGVVTLSDQGLTCLATDNTTISFNGSGMVSKDSSGNVFNVSTRNIMGTATNGQTVTFTNTWPSVPKVIVYPVSLIVQAPSYSSQKVTLHSYADNVTTSGFTLHCYSGIASAAGSKSYNQQLCSRTFDAWQTDNWTQAGATNYTFSLSMPDNVSSITINGHTSISFYTNNGQNLSLNSTNCCLMTLSQDSTTKYSGVLGNGVDTPVTLNNPPVSYCWSGSGSPYTNTENWTISASVTGDLTGTLMINPYFNGVVGDPNSNTVTIVIDSINFTISGEQVLDSSGTAAFLVTDNSNTNYTVS